MRYLALAGLLASACFLGVDDDDGESIGTGSESSGSASEATVASFNPTTDSGPDDTTASTSASSTTTSDPTSESDGESSTGEMAACETGPLPTPIPGCAPQPLPSTGDAAQDCVDRINQFRWECQCLPPLERWADAEQCSDEQSADDQAIDSPHGNFGACGEWAQNTCPNWGSEQDVIVGCLQAMWDEGPGEPFEAHGHYINMSSMNYTKVACGFASGGGGVWANQNFSE